MPKYEARPFDLPPNPLLRARPFVLLLLCCLTFSPAAAQDTVTGAFEGTVSDARTQARIPGAQVQIINRASGITLRRRADEQGRFYQGLLPPGVYTIRVSAPGYRDAEKEQLLFTTGPNQVVPIPFALEPDGAQAAAQPKSVVQPISTVQPAPAAPAERRDEVAEIDRTSARRAGAFTEREVSTLPLGATTLARSFDELALLFPGVAPPPQTLGSVAGPGVGAGVGTSGQFSANGLRSRGNNFTVDGSDNNDEDIGVRRQGFLALVPQPVESIKEFQVITLLAPAQFGRNIGAQVNAVSKSGGEQTHGALYGLFNSSQLNARDFFDTTFGNGALPLNAAGKPVLFNGRPITVRNGSGGEDSVTHAQGGLTLGGPLVPSSESAPGKSMFYFVSAEGQLLNAVREQSFAVPTVEQRGLFGTGASGISMNPLNGATVRAFPTTIGGDAVFSLFPFPNNPGGVYGPNTYTQTLPAGGQAKVLSGKLDANFRLRERQQSFTARQNFTDDYRDIPTTGGAIFSALRPRVRTQNLSLFLNSELSAPGASTPLFNQLRASYGRTRLAFDEVRDTTFLRPSRLSATLAPTEGRFLLNAPLLVNDTLPGSANVLYDSFFNFNVEDILGPLGQVSIAGFSPVGVDVFNFPQRRVNNTYQLADDLSWRRRAHSFVFGTDLRRAELNSDLARNARPLITFGGAPRLVTDAAGRRELRGFFAPVDLAAASAPSGVFQSITPGGGSAISLRYYQHNYFAQDSWRVRPDLSLSLGLRYEYNSPPRETARRIEETFDDPALALVPGLRSLLGGRTRIFDPDRDNFAPRVGFAYAPRPFGPERTTVLRAGFGVFYDQPLGAVVSQSRNVFPNFLTLNFAGGLPGQGGVGFQISDPSLPFFPCREGNTTRFVPVTQPGTLNSLNPAAPLSCLVQINSSFPGGFGFTLPARRFEMPTAYHYAFTFEQQLARTLVVSAAYVGTQGRRLIRLTSPNLGPDAFLIPTAINILGSVPNVSGLALGPGQRVDASGQPVGARPVAGAGAVFIYETSANSRYDSLQLQARGQVRNAFQYQLTYTLARAVDDVSDVFDLAGAPALPQNSLTRAGERAPSNFDTRQRLSYNFIYDLFGGLRLAGTGRLQTGQPFTVGSVFDVNLDGNLTDRPDSIGGIVETGERSRPLRLTGDPLALLAPIGQDGRVARNAFRAGGLIELDLSAFKEFNLKGDRRLLLRADIFNFINRANFGVPVRLLGATGFGQVTESVTTPRRVQLALKYLF